VAEQVSSDVKLEIGHVLVIDILAYSKLLITDQSERLQNLATRGGRDWLTYGTRQSGRCEPILTRAQVLSW
jgi:hypothetical protein